MPWKYYDNLIDVWCDERYNPTNKFRKLVCDIPIENGQSIKELFIRLQSINLLDDERVFGISDHGDTFIGHYEEYIEG